MDLQDDPPGRSSNLQFWAAGGRFLVLLGEDDGSDYDVRTFFEPAGPPGQIEIGGNYWDARTVITDFDRAKSVFKEYFDTGDVSRDSLT